MTERRALERGTERCVDVITPEAAPLAAFGPAASTAVGELSPRRRIAVVAAVHAHQEGG